MRFVKRPCETDRETNAFLKSHANSKINEIPMTSIPTRNEMEYDWICKILRKRISPRGIAGTFLIFCLTCLTCYLIYYLNHHYNPNDPFCDEWRCHFRKRAFWEPDFYANCLNGYVNPEDEYFSWCNQHDTPLSVLQCTKAPNFDNNSVNYFSFSVYGTAPKYFNELKSMVESILEMYPGWNVRIYSDQEFLDSHADIKSLQEIQIVEMCVVQDSEVRPGNAAGMFWRYLPVVEDLNVIVADSDLPLDTDFHDFFEADDEFVLKCEAQWAWPKDHIQGHFLKKRKLTKFLLQEGVDAKFIQEFPLRREFGADELFAVDFFGNVARKYGLRLKKPQPWWLALVYDNVFTYKNFEQYMEKSRAHS